MKSLIPFVLFVLIFGLGQSKAQTYEIYQGDTINRVDALGKRQGKWMFFNNATKNITTFGQYQDSKKEGVWVSFYSNGNKQAEITYKWGRKKGLAKIYYDTGVLQEEGYWDANRWTGVFKAYHANGKLAYDWNYNTMGRKTGTQSYYYDNGQLMMEGEWDAGKITGTIVEYNEDGSKRAERSFINGKVDHQQTKIYEPSEKLLAQREKEKENVSLPAGNPASTETAQFISNYFTGEGYHKLFKDNKISREGEFKEGQLHNGTKYIYHNNKLVKTIIYENGKATKVIEAPSE